MQMTNQCRLEQKKETALEPQTSSLKWMFGETTISYVKNHPIETTIYKWLFGVPKLFMADILHHRTGYRI